MLLSRLLSLSRSYYMSRHHLQEKVNGSKIDICLVETDSSFLHSYCDCNQKQFLSLVSWKCSFMALLLPSRKAWQLFSANSASRNKPYSKRKFCITPLIYTTRFSKTLIKVSAVISTLNYILQNWKKV